MTHSAEPLNPFEDDVDGSVDLAFLRDEGLELLALFQRIRDPEKRDTVRDLIRTILDDQPRL